MAWLPFQKLIEMKEGKKRKEICTVRKTMSRKKDIWRNIKKRNIVVKKVRNGMWRETNKRKKDRKENKRGRKKER